MLAFSKFTGIEVNVTRSALPPKGITLCLLAFTGNITKRKPAGHQNHIFHFILRACADVFLKSWMILNEELSVIPCEKDGEEVSGISH